MVEERTELSIVFLGNTTFSGLRQREHHLALELARRGYDVTFIEGMPSVASRVRDALRRSFAPSAVEQSNSVFSYPQHLKILTPPVVPTFFRSSYTPAIDKSLFRKWFHKQFQNCDWSNTVLMVMFPYWWDGFADRSICPARLVVYDVCDALEMPSRNATALHRMVRAELALAEDVDLVLYSARELETQLTERFPNAPLHYLPNAVPEEFLPLVQSAESGREKKVIGFVGMIDPRKVNRKLLEQTASAFPDCQVVIAGTIDRKSERQLRRYPNVRLLGPVKYSQLPGILSQYTVGLIPFAVNSITEVTNPLKLYEYCAVGMPIVAMETKELAHSADLLYLSRSEEEFIGNVRAALADQDPARRAQRIQFARTNTWSDRVEMLLTLILGKDVSGGLLNVC